MELDLIQKVVDDLQVKIVGARVAKIHQPEAGLFIFRLWNGRQNLKLLISASSRNSRIHLTEKSFPNPFTPPRFCQLLRARVSRITGVQVVNNDRMVKVSCLGPKGGINLYVELTGKSSNLILVDGEGRIIDSLKRQTDKAGRSTLPGNIYDYPLKLNEIDRTNSVPETASESGRIDIHQTVEKLYSSEQVKENTQDLKSRLKKIIASELRKLQKRLDRIEQERARQQEFEQYRQIGDLLLANLHQLKRGTTEASLLDYYQQPPAEVLVTLNPLLNPQENAEKYFQKSKKAKRGLEHSSRRKTETTAEVEWLSELDYQLSEAQDPADITLIADELATAGLLKEKSSKLPRRPAEKPKPYQEMKSPNGFRILWGNNSRQNDALSTKELKKGDLWFHAHRCPGSHVVLKAEGGARGFADEDIHLAASVAAANSRAKNDLKVEVMRVEACYVKKPAGAKPGMVTVKQYKTLMVEPFREESELF